MSTIDIVYGIGIVASIIIAIVAFAIALSKEKDYQEEDDINGKDIDLDFLDSERPFVSFNDQFN